MYRTSRAAAGALILVATMVVAACGSGSATAAPSASATGGAQPSSGLTASAECQHSSASGAYAMDDCTFTTPSLAGNLIGDQPSFHVYVLTPADYETSGKRYPTVYMLAGYTDPATGFAYGLNAMAAPAGPATLPIVVVVSGVNSFGGGFYVNSSVTGNWDDAVTRDLVGYVDAHYRTLAKREARGIAGHSMGGFGAVNLAMLHADVFGSLYALSPGLFDPTGVDERCGDPATVEEILAIGKGVAGKTGLGLARDLSSAASGETEFYLAYGLAFAPNPAAPMLMDFPFSSRDGKTVRDDAIWAKWAAGFGNLPARVGQYKSNLASLNGIVIDYGSADEYAWIPRGAHYFVGLLEDAGISAEERTYDGGHTDQVAGRLETQVIPFMQQKLATS